MENNPISQELQNTDSVKDLLQADIETYLMTTYSWHMTPEKIEQDFYEVLSILDNEQTEVARCLSHLNRSYFVERLTSRGVFTQSDIQAIAYQLDAIRLQKILAANEASGHQTDLNLRQQIEIYLIYAPKEHLLANDIIPSFQDLLENETNHEALIQYLRLCDRQEFRDILMQRMKHQQDITDEHLELILNALEATHEAVLLKHTAINGKAFDQEVEPSHQKIDSGVEPAEKSSFKSTQSTQQAASLSSWSTWDQVKWKPAAPAHQSNLSSLSWSTWAQLGSKIDTNSPTNIQRKEDDSSAS